MIKIKQYRYPDDFATYQYTYGEEVVIQEDPRETEYTWFTLSGVEGYFNYEKGEGQQTIKEEILDHGEPTGEYIYENWGPDLLHGDCCYNLAIHALPGSRFKVGDDRDTKNIITINATGNFSLDLRNYPIQHFRISQDNAYNYYPTIIDMVYAEAGEDD